MAKLSSECLRGIERLLGEELESAYTSGLEEGHYLTAQDLTKGDALSDAAEALLDILDQRSTGDMMLSTDWHVVRKLREAMDRWDDMRSKG